MAVVLEGTFRNGRVELKEQPVGLADNSPVLVTIPSTPLELGPFGIDPAGAGDLRSRLAGFGQEWDSPEMEDYDDYDAATGSSSNTII